HLRQIDVAAQKLAGRRFVVELLYPAIAEHHHARLLGVGGIDKHLVLGFHVLKSLVPKRTTRGRAPAGRRRPCNMRRLSLLLSWLVNGDRNNEAHAGASRVSGARTRLRLARTTAVG